MPRRRKVIAGALVVFALGLVVGATGSTFSAFSGTTANPTSFSSNPDWTAPTVTASKIGKATGGTPAGGRPGAVKTGGTYYAYANVTDSGNPASGVNTVTADLSGLSGSTKSAQALTATGGPWTVDGTTYNYRTASTLTVTGAASSFNYPVTVVDKASPANSAQQSFPVTIDNTAPSASDVQLNNHTGGTAGKAEQSDTIVLTFSEPIDPYSIIPSTSWNGTTAANVVVRLRDNGASSDTVEIWNAANSTQLNLGSINLARTSYNTSGSTVTFGATGTASTMVASGSTITITLGAVTGTAGTAGSTGTSQWTPSSSAFDVAGNAMSTTARNESGTTDLEF
jgi:hypothetical protein